jgi:hypothetical protein
MKNLFSKVDLHTLEIIITDCLEAQWHIGNQEKWRKNLRALLLKVVKLQKEQALKPKDS